MKKTILAIGIIILFILSSFIPLSIGYNIKISIKSNDRNILYVGGSGPGNYSKIQDAIDNTSNGDTVFVYNDSSPYYENIGVNKSINLIGEDSRSTVIDGSEIGDTVIVTTNWVNISRFSLQNSGGNGTGAGIKIHSNFSTITDNFITNNNIGLFLEFSSSNTISNNNISINLGGIICAYSSNSNNILRNNISDNWYGTLFSNSNANNVRYNSFYNSSVIVSKSYFNKIENNTINGKPLVYLEDESDEIIINTGQVILVNCNNITIENLNLSKTTIGIQLLETNNSKIQNNNCSNNFYDIFLEEACNNIIGYNKITSGIADGIRLEDSNNNTIIGNSISNKSGCGIYLNGFYNNINNNNISYNRKGMNFDFSENNTILSNSINYNNWSGIDLDFYNNNNMIIDNNISNNGYGIQTFYSNKNNTIAGNEIISNKNVGIQLHSHCDENIIISNFVFSNKGDGIYIRSNKNNILDNNISSNYGNGTYLRDSFNNTISDNILTNNKNDGINIYGANSNIISNNSISSNINFGINLKVSNSNTIIGNIISKNFYGINSDWPSKYNIIYHNNFINNIQNAYDEGNNTWDDGKYGNYWSDYEEKYPDAKPKLLKPWMWNTPYKIEGGSNKDNCPLVKQWPKSLSKTIPRNKAANLFILKFLYIRHNLLLTNVF